MRNLNVQMVDICLILNLLNFNIKSLLMNIFNFDRFLNTKTLLKLEFYQVINI